MPSSAEIPCGKSVPGSPNLHVLYDIAVDLMRLDLRTAGSKFGFLLKLR
jgi:hypothetical protein